MPRGQGFMATGLQHSLAWLRRHLVYGVVEALDRHASFAMIGPSDWRARTSEFWLGVGARYRRRFGVHGPNWSATAERMARRCGLVTITGVAISETLRPHLLTVPSFVGLRVDLLASEQALLQSFTRSAKVDVRRVVTRGYRFDCLSDPDWISAYMDRFHGPTMQARHGADNTVMSRDLLERLVTAGRAEFLRVHRDGRIVGAMVNAHRGAELHLLTLGWYEGDPDLLRAGVGELFVVSACPPESVNLSPATRASIARWYRLRDAPANEAEAQSDLPIQLRPWFDLIDHGNGRHRD